MTDLTNTAPKRIYLDIGDQFALERVTSGDLRWDLLDGVTWSEDNATSHGIPYVRADLVPTPAASGAAPADVPYDDCLNNLGWKMNDFLTSNGAIFDGHVFNNMKGFLRDCIMEWLAAHPSALASPQVAPAPVPDGFALVPVRMTKAMEYVTEQGDWEWSDLLAAAATPVQVAPTKTVILQMAEWYQGHEFDDYFIMKGAWEAIEKLKSFVPDPVALHPDDLAVDRFAAAMKEKLAGARAKGRGGWERPDCTCETLSAMLREHVEKGDPCDVANFCMFLHQRGEGISAPVQVSPTSRPLLWVSPEQASAHTNPDPDTEPTAGRYLPYRKTPAGKFTQPLYAAPVAPQDDARDAALWREHVAKLDALVTYCPTCCQGFYASKEMTRDEIIFECGKTVGRSTPAAKPTEPTLPTQGGAK